ncbi:MAG: FG-GAP-like repeat-containing protein [Arenicellales bacterium]
MSKVADMDGDGDMDIISASSPGRHHRLVRERRRQRTPPGRRPNIATTAAAAKADLEAADMDGDGDLDIVCGLDGTTTPLPGTRTTARRIPPGRPPTSLPDANGARDVSYRRSWTATGIWILWSASTSSTTPLPGTRTRVTAAIRWCWTWMVMVLSCSALAAGITFDVDADGVLETTGWVGPDDGLLVMDLDGSGQIEDMSEVFSEVFNGGNYTDSLAALATLDTNADQVISAEDDRVR